MKRGRSWDEVSGLDNGLANSGNEDKQYVDDYGGGKWEAVGVEALEPGENDEDDGLGYYSDGVKRTLTDEQVAMFRHSEIYAIQRQRQVARENLEADEGEEGEERDAEIKEDDDTAYSKVLHRNPTTTMGSLHPPEDGTMDRLDHASYNSTDEADKRLQTINVANDEMPVSMLQTSNAKGHVKQWAENESAVRNKKRKRSRKDAGIEKV